MTALRAIAVAFGMYSQIPMPRIEWDKKSLRYALCAFPLIGIVQGILCLLWGMLNRVVPLPEPIVAVGFLLIPLAVNGGIHLDGLSDTADALASNAPREKRLEILKDSHIGAFGVLALVVYLLVLFSAYSAFSLDSANLYALGCVFALSRALSGLTVVTWPSAKKDGTAHAFREGSAGRSAGIILLVQIFIYALLLVFIQGILGAIMVGAAALAVVVYRMMAMRTFGGVTGDLAGWFLQIAELIMVLTLVIGGCFL